MSSCVLDPAWHVELSRLENLCALYDQGTTAICEQPADDTITVLPSDVTVEPPPQGRLGLVHARLLLEHLPASKAVLRAMRARRGRAARSWWRTWTGPPRSP